MPATTMRMDVWRPWMSATVAVACLLSAPVPGVGAPAPNGDQGAPERSSFAWRVDSLPADNLLKNPWFRTGNRPSLEHWVSDAYWTASNKHGNPTPDDVEGTAARISTGRTDEQRGKTVDAGVETCLYQIVSADPSLTKLKFDMYWVTHTVNPVTVRVYGGPSREGPWTEVWKPFHHVQTTSLRPKSGSRRGQDLWKDFSDLTDLATTTLSLGYPHYKLEIRATLPDKSGGLKITGVYFTAVAADFDPAELRPFTNGGLYLGQYEMGLYPGGKNEMPQSHRQAGERIAATIRPLNVDGVPDEEHGRILAVVFGHSNCSMYFSALERRLRQQGDELHPRFQMLNAAIGGNQLPEISQLQGSVWAKAERMVGRPGYSLAQVQVLFLHTTYHGAGNRGKTPPRPFPETMQRMKEDLAKVLEHAVKVFPNLKVAYLTCDGFRHFTNYEPHVYQEAFAFKWLIESQIRDDKAAAFEGPDRKLPWLTWGPYIWDNTWDRSYFTDGVHPAPKAQEIFVDKYWKHLQNDSVAKPWLWRAHARP